ncbi:MAG TPA: hypothetical protein VMU99_05050 [Acidimicrobiales bacterium]|nr:hypothetical protein [Acidimicrobiales bacterium]
MRRRFLVVGIAGLVVFAATMSVSFLGSTGTTNATVAAASSNFIYPVANTNPLPSAVNSLKNTPASAINQTAHTITTASSPSWSPTALSAGSVTSAGDIALIDATIASNGIVVSLYITNLAGLQQDYNSFALPVDIYSSPCTSGSCTWSQASGVIASPPTYLTSSSGFINFNLPANSYYDITLDTGGSYYCTSTSTAGTASLTPSFYLTAQPY